MSIPVGGAHTGPPSGVRLRDVTLRYATLRYVTLRYRTPLGLGVRYQPPFGGLVRGSFSFSYRTVSLRLPGSYTGPPLGGPVRLRLTRVRVRVRTILAILVAI